MRSRPRHRLRVDRDATAGRVAGRAAAPLAATLLVAVACSTPGPEGPPLPAAAPLTVEVLRALPAGTVVRLLPVQRVVAADTNAGAAIPPSDAAAAEAPGSGGAGGNSEREDAFLNGIWREAMRVSAWLDVAAGTEDAPAAQAVSLQLDPRSRTLTSTLLVEGQPPLPLAAARCERGREPVAVDALAAATRGALGDPGAAGRRFACARLYSAEPRCVEATERAAVDAARGNLFACGRLLQRARQADPGCTMTLAALAELQLRQGDAATAARTADEALRLQDRLAPTTAHRLARTLLMARAALAHPLQVGALDEELLRLALTAREERPHDPHVRCTEAIALCYLRRFTAAAPELRALRERWPSNAFVDYLTCFAELACGRADAALAAIERAALRLPLVSVVVPTALSLYALGAHERLAQLLEDATTDASVQQGSGQHHVLRMQAAHALLTGRPDDAASALLRDLEWLRQRPSLLTTSTLDVVEAGEVLVRLGRTSDLAVRVRALRALGPGAGEELGVGLSYLEGLLHVERTGEHATAVEADLEARQETLWSGALKAAAHRRRGELLDETRELTRVTLATDAPLQRAAFARVLRIGGREADARALLQEMREELLRIDLRHLERHALLSPAAALALAGG